MSLKMWWPWSSSQPSAPSQLPGTQHSLQPTAPQPSLPASTIAPPTKLTPQSLPSTSPTNSTTTASLPVSTIPPPSSTRVQLPILLAGTVFVLLSTRLTARTLTRKRIQTTPSFYHPSNAHPTHETNAGLEAFEALSLATINVLSGALFMTGGLLWAFDVKGMDDLRKKVRGGLGVDGTGRDERDVEEEFEEWLATTLERKKEKEFRKEWEAERKNERGRPR
ncbi:hypothetical protein MMC25_001850 [Agyrium rufum]|nr:hypothetical protein [Agyrium rufum]